MSNIVECGAADLICDIRVQVSFGAVTDEVRVSLLKPLRRPD